MSRVQLRNADDAARAAPVVRAHLARGGVILHPTGTLYGLGALLAPASLETLAAIKPRLPDQPFLILVDGLAMADSLGLAIGPTAHLAANRFWPGPLTLVVADAERSLPESVRNAGGGVAIRETAHPGTRALVRILQSPITSSSANRPGEEPVRDADEAEKTFAEFVQRGDLLLLDGGALESAAASTMLDCTTDPPTVLRVGALSPADLDEALGSVQT